jgi:hypothetical protein
VEPIGCITPFGSQPEYATSVRDIDCGRYATGAINDYAASSENAPKSLSVVAGAFVSEEVGVATDHQLHSA